MDLRIIIAVLASLVFVGAENIQHPFYNSDNAVYTELGDVENFSLESSLTNLIPPKAKDSNTNNYNYIQPYPYQQELPSADASVSISKPAVQIDKEFSVVKPRVDVLRFVEDFIKWKSELITRAQALFNENFGLIKLVINFVLSKLSSWERFWLKGISVLRGIIEFVLNIFSGWNSGSSLLLG